MKYELTDNTKTVNGVKLYQIQALKDFGNVKAGDLGGWIEKEKNLSQEGDCWVYDNAQVFGNAQVSDNARVSDNAWVYDNAQVFGDAEVSDIWCGGGAKVFGDAEVSDIWCGGGAKVGGNTSTSTVKEQNPFDFNTLPEDVVVKGIRYKKEITWKKIS